MKKTLCVLIALCMVFTMLPVNVMAAGIPTLYFETTYEEGMTIGDTFTVVGYFENNPTVGTMTVDLDWNEDVLQFNGFDANKRGNIISEVFDSTAGYVTPVVNQSEGIIVAVDVYGYDLDGVLYTANFEIIGEGEMDLHYNPMKYEIKNLDGSQDVIATIDYSAIEGLKVGGNGTSIPTGAPFSGVTTDAGDILAIEQLDDLPVDPWGMGMYDYIPYYHITVPEDATEAQIRFDETLDYFMAQTDMYGEPEIGSAYASVNSDYAESGMAGLKYEKNDDHTVVLIPLVFEAMDAMWNTVELSAVKSDEEIYYAVGPEDSSAAPIALFSFEYGEAESDEAVYAISVVQPEGGTVAVSVEEAAAGEEVFVTYQADAGYRFKYFLVNGEAVNLENGCLMMPAEDVLITALFEEIHTCAYNKEVVDEKYLKSEATCESGAVYYKSCVCGEFDNGATAATFVGGEAVHCVYVDGACKWCGTAEPVTNPGYRFATSADVSAENGGTAVVHVKITGHSNPKITVYNAYDLTLTFDSEKLEYVGYTGAVLSDNGSVTVNGNEIRIVGCGADKTFGTEIAALTFQTKAEGAANVVIDKVQVSDKDEAVTENIPEATAKFDDEDNTADETPDVSVIVVPYTVTKPGFISGADKVLEGQDYSFSFTDTTHYTYSDLTVTVGGVEVTAVEENGVYTISNVSGAVEITATQTANTYDVVKPEHVTGSDKATYGTDYVFTVSPSSEDVAIDSVKVTDQDGNEIAYTINEAGEYVIAGSDIVGAFTITVTEKEKMTTVTFTGVSENEIKGGLTQSAEINKKFPFELVKQEGFSYTVKIGDQELTESNGVYTIPAELVVKGGVTVTIEKVDITTAVVDVQEYISLDGRAMFLVTAKWGSRVLAFGEGNTMFWSDQYTVGDEAEAGAYCWLILSTEEMNTVEQIKAAAEAAIVEATDTATVIKYNYDVNDTIQVDVNDAQLTYDMYNASYMEFTENLPMRKFLEADMMTDGKLDTQDVAAIINYIVGAQA